MPSRRLILKHLAVALFVVTGVATFFLAEGVRAIAQGNYGMGWIAVYISLCVLLLDASFITNQFDLLFKLEKSHDDNDDQEKSGAKLGS